METFNAKRLILLALVVILGAALRLDLLIANNFIIDSDEAIVGLMGKHILEGAPIPVFYYGQHYMGSLEAVTAALFFCIGGITPAVLKLVPFFYSLLLIIATYSLARGIWGENEGYLSALFIAVPASPLVIWSTMARGGFIEIVLLSVLVLIAMSSWLRRKSADLHAMITIGFLSGIGWWVNNQILYVMITVAVFTPLYFIVKQTGTKERIVSLLKGSCVGGIAFIIGGFPFWWYNITHNFSSFGLFSRAPVREVVSHAEGVATTALPILLGAKRFWGNIEIFPSAQILVYALFGILLAVYLGRIPRTLIASMAPLSLLVFILSAIGIFCISSFGYLVQAPRYLLPLYPALSIVAASAIMGLPTAFFKAVGVGIILSLNLASSYLGGRAIPGEPFVAFGERASKDHSELIAWLISKNYAFVRTNYWIGYRLALETEERVRFVTIHEPEQIRIPSYIQEGQTYSEEKLPVVLTSQQAVLWRTGLRTRGAYFQEIPLSGYIVLYEIKEDFTHLSPLDLSQAQISSTFNQKHLKNIIDGNLQTRWGSASPQSAGMEVRVVFPELTNIDILEIDLGSWPQDYPRGLRIELIGEKGEVLKEFDEIKTDGERYLVSTSYDDIRVKLEGQEIKEIRLLQTRSDPIFDWSIAELRLFARRVIPSAKSFDAKSSLHADGAPRFARR